MSQDRLTPLDASFLHLEDPSSPMHVAGVMIFDGEAPAYADFVAHVGSRLSLVPRYRRRLAWVPFGQGRPKWVDDEHFDIRYHVRATALPSPGGEEELKTLAGRVFAVPLNREKPMWELWLVEGLAENRFAVLSKTHHAVVDGISSLDILSVLFAPASETDTDAARDWRPEPVPSGLSLLTEALVERATVPGELVRPLRALARRPRHAVERVVGLVAGLGTFAWAGLSGAPRTRYNRSIVGTNRRFTWVRASLADVKAIKNALGGTVNDVILTVVTRALRAHLVSHGEEIEGLTLKAFVPVSVRGDDDRGGDSSGNQVSGMIAPLPVGCPDPKACLATIGEAMRGLKESGQAVGAQALTELSGFAPAALLDQASRLQVGQRFVNLVVTNVPGPQFPLYLADRELEDIFPMVPLGNNLNLGVAIVSYNGKINFGLVSDFDNLPDLEQLAEHFGEGLAELAEIAGVELTAEADSPPREQDGSSQVEHAPSRARSTSESETSSGHGEPSPRSTSPDPADGATHEAVAGNGSPAKPAAGNGSAPERSPAPAPDKGEVDIGDSAADGPTEPPAPEPTAPPQGSPAHIEVEHELVESFGERGAESGASADVNVAEPWPGYGRMKAAEIRERLADAPTAAIGMVELYERSHKARKQVLSAAERALRTAPRR